MPGYATVRGDLIFFDRGVEGLSDEAFRLMSLCFFGPGRTVLGVRRFTVADVLARMPAWGADKAQAALDELEAAGLVEHDPQARLLFFAPQFEHAPIRGLNSIRGAIKVLEELPDSPALIRPLEHLLEAVDLELEKPAGSKVRSELTGLTGDFEARLKASRALITPLEGVSGGETQANTPSGPPLEGVSSNETQPDTPSEPPSEGVSGCKKQSGTPLGGGREGVSPRARALPEQEPEQEQYPEQETPSKSPPTARASPGRLALGEQGGREGPGTQEGHGKGKYGHLDQRKRQT